MDHKELKNNKPNSNSDNSKNTKAEYLRLALKILTPLDKALNIIHLHEPVRKVYFALADSRERLIQFTSLPNHEITKNLMPILIQMNRLLNTITRLRQDDPFDERKEFQIVEHIIKWRSLTKDVILELSGGKE
ncbi:MAG: hypothetical protein HWN67_03590 [Candidatus Helarchaeota archaeon]|nr:hypothetical protein [Candidatus Helarchaeota archaeon]